MHLSQSTTFATRRIGSRGAIPAEALASHPWQTSRTGELSSARDWSRVKSTKHTPLRKVRAQANTSPFAAKPWSIWSSEPTRAEKQTSRNITQNSCKSVDSDTQSRVCNASLQLVQSQCPRNSGVAQESTVLTPPYCASELCIDRRYHEQSAKRKKDSMSPKLQWCRLHYIQEQCR
jgi:hypothetical protein